MQQRIFVFDIVRTIAIFIIIFHHLPEYIFNFYNLNNFNINIDLSGINTINRYIGIGLFVFISGYLINIKNVSFYDINLAREFFIKKINRLFPLYYIALPFFFYMSNINDCSTILIHILGLQSLLYSETFPSLMTVWFIGTILIYYIVFIILKLEAINFVIRILFIITLPFILFTLQKIFHVTEPRIVLYYIIFLIGIYSAKKTTIYIKKIH